MTKIRESKESLVNKIKALVDENAKLTHQAQAAIQRRAEMEESLKRAEDDLRQLRENGAHLLGERDRLFQELATAEQGKAEAEARCAQLLNQQPAAEEELAKLRTTVRCLTLGLKGAAAALPD